MAKKKKLIHAVTPCDKHDSKGDTGKRDPGSADDDSEEGQWDDLTGVIPIISILAQQQFGNVEYLRLRAMKGQLPFAFFAHPAFENLRILNLRDCKLKNLPPEISLLTKLRYLDITGMPHIELPFQLSRLNLQRILCSPELFEVAENFSMPYEPHLTKHYCGDRVAEAVAKLSRLAAEVLVRTCTLAEIDELREALPLHLNEHVVPQVCAECGSLGRKIVATRVRKTMVAFHSLPLRYPLCSVRCLQLLQDSWELENVLNREKRLLRQQKFGSLEESSVRYEVAH